MYRLTCILATALLILAGCGSPRPIKYYVVQGPAAPTPALSGTVAYPIDLAVKRLTGPSLLESAPIAYRRGPNEMGTYTYHRWEDAPVELVKVKLLRVLRNTGQYQSVTDLGYGGGAEFVVRGRLDEFGELGTPALSGQVTMEFELYNRRTGKVLWTHFYSQNEPAQGKEVSDIVQAIERNLDRGLKEVAAGLGQYFAANPPGRTASGS
jgi:ABC-type uncharacterized transport system auxiliary subunit